MTSNLSTEADLELETNFITSLVRKGDYGDIDLPTALLHLFELADEHGFICCWVKSRS